MFGPNVLKTRVLRGSILVISTYLMTWGIETPCFIGFGVPKPSGSAGMGRHMLRECEFGRAFLAQVC